jgi:hypothetical protein
VTVVNAPAGVDTSGPLRGHLRGSFFEGHLEGSDLDASRWQASCWLAGRLAGRHSGAGWSPGRAMRDVRCSVCALARERAAQARTVRFRPPSWRLISSGQSIASFSGSRTWCGTARSAFLPWNSRSSELLT